DEDPVGWNALKAKIADELGQTTEAFDAAVAMNAAALKAAGKSIDLAEFQREAAAYRAEQHQLARTITPEWADRIPRLPTPFAMRVAFLLGFPRSGTTLLDTFLMGHPDIAVLEEKQLLAAAGEVAGPITDLPGRSLDTLEAARAA